MMPGVSNFCQIETFPSSCLLPDDAGEEKQDDGEEADPDGAHV